MKGKIIERIKKDELVKGSFILFIMINICNLLNQIFHIFMTRSLGPVDYGTLAVLLSIMYIFSIPSEAVQNVIASYTSKLNSEKGKIKFLVYKSMKRSLLISSILFILYLPLAFFLSSFLKIDFLLLVIGGTLIFTFFSCPTLRGILQGQKKFGYLGFNLITESAIKVILGIILVFLGLKVYGAIFAVVIGAFVSFFLAFFFIKDILEQEIKKENFNEIYSYSVPYFISIISIALIFSLDIIFAKRFFSSDLAGKYSAASAIGKIIFLGILAISKAMLPLTSEKFHSGEKTKPLLKKSLIIIAFISGIILLFYLFIPSLIIKILFGSRYLEVSNILFIMGLGFTFLSFVNIIILYGISINRIKNSSFSLFIFVILEVVLFYIFHDSLMQYSIVFLIINFLMFIYSLFLIKDNDSHNNSSIQ